MTAIDRVFRLALVVEGHGDALAAPIVVRRIVDRIGDPRRIEIHNPYRVPRNRIVKAGELERYVELTSRQVGPGGAVLVLLDADDDCPASLGPSLLQRCRDQRPDRSHGVVLAKAEFEAWFLAAAVSLRGSRGLNPALEPPADPELIRGAKGWLQRQRTDGRGYSETLDQPALAREFDLDVARDRCPSFEKLWRDVGRLLAETAEEGA